MFSACGPERRSALVRAQLALDERPVEVEEVEPAGSSRFSRTSATSSRSEALVIGRPPSPATTS